MRVLVHEPSLVERGLFCETLIETLELTDEEDFFRSNGKLELCYPALM